MSISLINKGLELIESDLHTKPNEGVCRSSNNVIKNKRDGPSKKLKKQLKKKNLGKSLPSKKIKNYLKLLDKETKRNRTSENIKALRNLDSHLSKKIPRKVKEEHLGKLDEEDLKTCLKKFKKTESSAFTEDDFEKMKNEWQKFS